MEKGNLDHNLRVFKVSRLLLFLCQAGPALRTNLLQVVFITIPEPETVTQQSTITTESRYRDAVYFRYVLNHMRSIEHKQIPHCKSSLEAS